MIHTLLFLLTVHSVDYYHLNHQFSFHYCNCVYSNILSIVDFNPSFRCYGYHCSHIWVDFWTRTSFVFFFFAFRLPFAFHLVMWRAYGKEKKNNEVRIFVMNMSKTTNHRATNERISSNFRHNRPCFIRIIKTNSL